jgi:hypothetical protein
MTTDERKKRLIQLEEEKAILLAEMELKNIKSNASRSRSITVGTAFGGVTEISMRGDGEQYLWCIMQPVEVTELIHQLAGNIGCHIALQPRKDFASWRAWKPDENLLSFSSHPPHPNDMAVFQGVGAGDAAETSSGLKLSLQQVNEQKLIYKTKEKNEQQSLAVEKVINKRKPKRTTTAS